MKQIFGGKDKLSKHVAPQSKFEQYKKLDPIYHYCTYLGVKFDKCKEKTTPADILVDKIKEAEYKSAISCDNVNATEIAENNLRILFNNIKQTIEFPANYTMFDFDNDLDRMKLPRKISREIVKDSLLKSFRIDDEQEKYSFVDRVLNSFYIGKSTSREDVLSDIVNIKEFPTEIAGSRLDTYKRAENILKENLKTNYFNMKTYSKFFPNIKVDYNSEDWFNDIVTMRENKKITKKDFETYFAKTYSLQMALDDVKSLVEKEQSYNAEKVAEK